jgi:type II secretory pathway pseudopilin PulG
MKTPLLQRISRKAYTLIEVLAAGAVVAVGAGAAASLAASVGIQEDLARRVAVTRNYQENMARLWQLGLEPVDIIALMPTMDGNRYLNAALFDRGQIIPQGTVSVGGASGANTAAVETAICRISANIARNPAARQEGSPMDILICRPTVRATPN